MDAQGSRAARRGVIHRSSSDRLLGRKQGDVLKLKLIDAQNQYRVTAVV
jgi:hypothetical protein